MKNHIKKIIRNIPVVSGAVKKHYDRKQELNLDKKINDFLAEKKLPHTDTVPANIGVGHEPTIRCNLKCKMCYQGQTRNLRQDELNPAEVREIYNKLKDKLKMIKIVGGEPMLRPDIYDMIGFWDKLGKRVVLQTNCTLINEENASKLAQFRNLTDIATSLDGPEEVHDEIRGVPGTYQRMTKAIGILRQKRPDINITAFGMILFNEGLEYIPKLIKASRALGLPSINLLFEQVYSAQNVENAKKILAQELGWQDVSINTQVRDPIFEKKEDPEKIKNELDRIFKAGVKERCYANFTPYNYYLNLDKFFNQKPTKVFCTKLLNPEFRINQKGEVFWCDIIGKSFGNLLKKNPDEIWLSQEWQNFRRFLLNHSLPICTRCCKAVYIKD